MNIIFAISSFHLLSYLILRVVYSVVSHLMSTNIFQSTGSIKRFDTCLTPQKG